MLGDDKLQDIVDLMMEKEMRIQIPVEEIAILRGDENVMKDLWIKKNTYQFLREKTKTSVMATSNVTAGESQVGRGHLWPNCCDGETFL